MGYHVFAWITVAVLAGLWSSLCWLAHTLLGWEGWSRGLDSVAGLPRVELPPWLQEWLGLDGLARFNEWMVALAPHLQSWLDGMPALGSWLSALVWIVWVVGLGMLGLLGLAASALIALVQRSARPLPPSQHA